MFETLLTPERIARETGAGYWRNKVITDFLDEHADATPHKVAFIDSRRQVTIAELKAEVDRVALGLAGRGIRPGDVISFGAPLPSPPPEGFPGDMVELEIEGVGILRNSVVQGT